MVYNFSFENVGMMMSIMLIFLNKFLFDKTEKSNKLFRRYVIATFVECTLDIFCARGINGDLMASDTVNIWLNTAYFLMTVVSAFLGFKMISSKMEFTNKVAHICAELVLVLGMVFIFANGFTGMLFTFKDGQYITTEYAPFINIASFILVGSVPFIVWNKRKKLGFNERIAPVVFMIAMLLAFVFQQIFPAILLSGFGKAMSGLLYMLLLETPQHVKVKLAVEELKEAQEREIKTIDALTKANDEKTKFLVAMTHQLRTPINAILGFSEIYKKENTQSPVYSDVDRIQTVGEHILDVVDDIVDFAQIETGDLEIRPREYEISEAYLLFREVMEKHESSYLNSINRTVNSDIPKRLYGDVRKISKICEKLCNYLESPNEDNGLTLDVNFGDLKKNKIYAHITIKDKKSVLDEEKLLSNMDVLIVKKQIECMGGIFNYKSVEGGGTSFNFIIEQEIVDLKPVGELTSALERYELTKSKDENKLTFVMPNARILVVDDTKVNLLVVEGLLAPYKAKVVCVDSGAKALEIMKSQEFDFIFMDILMPEMDGVETLKHIRNDEGILSKDAVIVALTANIFSGAKTYYKSEGFADYITKPVNGRRLSRAFRELIPDKLEEDWSKVDVTKASDY